jgi:hypothetical protein
LAAAAPPVGAVQPIMADPLMALLMTPMTLLLHYL